MSKFLFYGCWNNVNCEKEYIYRDLVLNYINKNEKKISTFFVAGDNWYSTKVPEVNEGTTNFINYYLLSILRTGYYKLYQLNKTIHIAVGNHDEDDDGDRAPLKKRCMIKTQKKYIDELNEKDKKDKEIDSSVSKSYDKSYSKIISPEDDTSHGLFVKTDKLGFKPTLYELSKMRNLDIRDNIMNIYVDGIGIVNNKNYIVIIINTNKLNDPNYLRAIHYKFKYVNRIKQHKQVFVMGHVPLFAVKKDSIKNKDELFGKRDNLFKLLSYFNYIYICADAHYFSIMEIKKSGNKVIQITSGTGGAYPDINKEYYNKKNNIIYHGYNIKYFLLNSYGYSIISIYKCKIKIIYKQVFLVNDSDMRSNGNKYIYFMEMNNGSDGYVTYNDVEFRKNSKIKKKLSKYKLESIKNDKEETCKHIRNQKENIKNNVVTSEDNTKYCFKKIK